MKVLEVFETLVSRADVPNGQAGDVIRNTTKVNAFERRERWTSSGKNILFVRVIIKLNRRAGI